MNFPRCKTVKKSLPIFLEGGNEGVLFIHGYTGSPHDFEYMAKEVNRAGFTVSVPRLPGHGTCGEDFLTTTARDWLRRAFDAYYDLKAICDRVYVVGLSNGWCDCFDTRISDESSQTGYTGCSNSCVRQKNSSHTDSEVVYEEDAS